MFLANILNFVFYINNKGGVPPEILENLKKEIEEENLKSNMTKKLLLSNCIDCKIDANSNSLSINSISILDINGEINKNNFEKNNGTYTIIDSLNINHNKKEIKMSKLSNSILNVLNADIIRNKGIKLCNDSNRNNLTHIEKINPIESIFDLKIDDENDENNNSCNKTNYNITLVYVPENKPLNITCNKTIVPIPDSQSNKTDIIPCNKTNICAPNQMSCCAEDILKKLFLKEILETKKLKHKLIKLYLERKRLKKEKEKQNKIFAKINIDKPPIFNVTDFEK